MAVESSAPHDRVPGSARPPGTTTLPQSFTSLVGRDADIVRVAELLRADTNCLVTITGFGGIGKTRLAVAVAQELSQEWHRIWFISLAHTHEAITASALIARQVGASPESDVRADQTTVRDLQAGPCLLVLDNFEHVLDAADQVAAILHAWPLLTVLVTSRAPLHLSAEQVYVLDPLSTRLDDHASSAMRLFVERARAQQRDFRLNAEENTAVHQVCARLEGIPLAIELAAARIHTMSPSDMLRRLDSQLSLLTGGPRDAPARQRTLRDTIAWSYTLLDADHHHTLNVLSVFNGGFTIAAASAVLALSESTTIDRIGALLASGLVQRHPNRLTPDARYRLLDPVREFAFEHLTASGAAPRVRLTHARFYTALVEDSLPLYDGPDLIPALQRTSIEIDNFRSAIAWSLDGGNTEDGVRLAGALWRHWAHRYMGDFDLWTDRFLEGFRLTQLALAHADGLSHEAKREALIGMPYLATNLERSDDLEMAISDLEKQAFAAQDPYSMYWAVFVRWRTQVDLTGTIPEAEDILQELDALAAQARNPENQMAGSHFSIGEHLWAVGEHERALPIINQGMEFVRQCGNPLYLAWASKIQGDIALDLGDHEAALIAHRQSFATHDELGSDYWNTNAYNAIALIAVRNDRTDLALRMLTPRSRTVTARYSTDIVMRELREIIGDKAMQDGLEAAPPLSFEDRDALIDELLALLRDRKSPTPSSPVETLTPRECEVLQHLGMGESNRVIADHLFISERTVESHVQHILAKLGVPNRASAAAWTARNPRT